MEVINALLLSRVIMAHSPSQPSQAQPLGLEQFVAQLRAIWLDGVEDDAPERTQWTLGKIAGLVGSLYELLAILSGLVWRAQHMVREGDWTQIDELAHEGWEELRERVKALISEHLDAVEWFEVVEELDTRVVTWLTDPDQIERVRGVLEAVEWRIDRLIGHGLDIMFAQAKPSSPVTKLLEHQDDIERWMAFFIERMLTSKT
jgi:hypothetical protein